MGKGGKQNIINSRIYIMKKLNTLNKLFRFSYERGSDIT